MGQDGNVARKNVTADNLAGSNFIVTSGLSNGDQVIVSGLQMTRPGAKVVPKVVAGPGAPKPAQPAAATAPGS